MSPVIEGAVGRPLTSPGAPAEGTTEIQHLTIGGTPTGGTFRLGFMGSVSPDITWSATNNTLLANIAAALNGVKAKQTITFGGTPTGGTFRLSVDGQVTAAIAWSATNNTLIANIDAALEALKNIGTGGVATVVGTMTAGIGTITVEFPTTGPRRLITPTSNRLTGTAPTVAIATTTTGVHMPAVGDSGVTVADVSLTAGIGALSVTFTGTAHRKRVRPLMTVENNSLTGTAPTLVMSEATAGVDAFGRGLAVGAEVLDTVSGRRYVNVGTPDAPAFMEGRDLGAAETVTIASGVATVTKPYVILDAEGAGTTDQLDSIAYAGASQGDRLLLTVNATDTITVDDANINLGAATRAIAPGGSLLLLFDGVEWTELSFLAAADNV